MGPSSVVPSLLTLGILGFADTYALAAQVHLLSPTVAVPVFILGHHSWHFGKRHPRSPGCQCTKRAFFLVRVGRVQSNSENWRLSSSSSRHISLDHHRATNPKVMPSSHPWQHTDNSRENEILPETVKPDL